MSGRTIAIPVAAAVVMGVTACGAANESSSGKDSGLSGTLSGSGSSAQQSAQQAWKAGFHKNNSNVTVNYDSIGSGDGRNQFISGKTDFAGSDAYMKPDEIKKAKKRCGSDVVEVPVYISPIAIGYNLKGVKNLNLSPATLAGIFAQKIKKWNDPKIKKDNPGVKLPSTAITPVNRSDKSGTTENFTDYLSQTAPKVWTKGKTDVWPIKGGETGKKTDGEVSKVKAADGAIGYIDASQIGNISQAKIKVGSQWTKASSPGATKAVDGAKLVKGRSKSDFAYDMNRKISDKGAYPLALMSWEIGCSKYKDPKKGKLVKAWFQYLISSDAQQAAAKNAGSAPISPALSKKLKTAVDTIK